MKMLKVVLMPHNGLKVRPEAGPKSLLIWIDYKVRLKFRPIYLHSLLQDLALSPLK